MIRYNYFYNGVAIPRMQFLNAVPDNWEDEVVDGEFSFGYFSACIVES